MLPLHNKYIQNFFVSRRVALLQGFFQNDSLLSLLNLELLQYIIATCGVPNSDGILLMKSLAFSYCIENYKYPHVNFYQTCRPPAVSWLLTFMELPATISSEEVVFVGFVEKPFICRLWMKLLRECTFWTNCTRWHVPRKARLPKFQLLLYESDVSKNILQNKLIGIIGQTNFDKFCFVRSLDNSYDQKTQLFISPMTNVIQAMKKDVIFEGFSCLWQDNRVMSTQDYKTGFIITV